MVHLKSFSYTTEGHISQQIGSSMSENPVGKVIENLPLTCTNLEVNSSQNVRPGIKSGHLCCSIARVLPRMEQVHLCPDEICHCISLHNGVEELSQNGQLVFVNAPRLISLVINLGSVMNPTKLCPRDSKGLLLRRSPRVVKNAFPSAILHGMDAYVAGSFPAATRISFFDTSNTIKHQLRFTQTLNERNLISQERHRSRYDLLHSDRSRRSHTD